MFKISGLSVICCLSLTLSNLWVENTSAQHVSNFSTPVQDGAEVDESSVNSLIIDSDIKFEEAVAGKNIPGNILLNLELVNVYYYGFNGNLRKGQLVVHKDVVQDVEEIFDFIRETKFPLDKVVPLSEYNWSDEESMKENNTSAFNYRFISGTRVISKHASGLAIDINPKLNPYIKNEVCTPEGSTYDTTKTGTLKADSPLVLEFKQRGWKWGGDWKNLKDYQHFEKNLK
jgi:hypothetical protein